MAGPIVFAPGQYTHCVDRSAYRDVPKWYEASAAAILEFTLCNYLLGGKLVCLAGGRDECAIGIVVSREEVGSKTGIDALDNDFSFNMLLLPFRPNDFIAYRDHPDQPASFEPHKIRDDVVNNSGSPFAPLMVDPNTALHLPGLPTPHDPSGPPTGTSPLDGYGVLYKWDQPTNTLVQSAVEGDNLHKLRENNPQDGSLISLPVLHLECEGSRIFFVCQAMSPFLDALQGKVPGFPGPSPADVCHATLGWLPFGIGDAICSFVEDIIALPVALALAPAMAAAFATAWEAAQAYDDLFVTGPVAKQVRIGEVYVVTGRWTWDAGHAGHTELHPVKTIQRLEPGEVQSLLSGHDPRQPLPQAVLDGVNDVRNRWCRHVQEAPPPPDPRGDGKLTPPQIGALTPEQLGIYSRQLQPENAWIVHPLLDGCTPHEQPQPPR